MTLMAVACLASVVVLVPRDLFVAHTRDVEVWFGFEVRGTAALLTAPVHWAIFLVGAWGFWFRRPWIGMTCRRSFTPGASAHARLIATALCRSYALD
jgi:hypothetical protein